jgi:hypothetical protein
MVDEIRVGERGMKRRGTCERKTLPGNDITLCFKTVTVRVSET